MRETRTNKACTKRHAKLFTESVGMANQDNLRLNPRQKSPFTQFKAATLIESLLGIDY